MIKTYRTVFHGTVGDSLLLSCWGRHPGGYGKVCTCCPAALIGIKGWRRMISASLCGCCLSLLCSHCLTVRLLLVFAVRLLPFQDRGWGGPA